MFLVSVGLLAGPAHPAFAQEATPDGFATVQSTVSRAAVHADTVAALSGLHFEESGAEAARLLATDPAQET